ncbi:MAG: GDP-mannose 4,6-dehydratase, partial [Candidatus Andersenbacteria bacterium]|nr:GDP-mannose 4,6-dehydratase [Candidatus Andersenbacteria bacterium]
NVDGTRHLLELVRSVSPATHILVVSSSDIYGRGSAELMAELPLDECRPQNPYAMSKWEMEQMIEKNFNDMVMRVRPFPHIGPGQGPDFVTAAFASQIAAIEQGKQEAVVKVGNLDAKRDYTDVRDVVRAYRLLMEKGKLGEVYHVASGNQTPIQGMLDKFLSLATKPIHVEQDPARMRPSDVPSMVGDATKLSSVTGWQPEIPLGQTLQEILDYWREKSRTS